MKENWILCSERLPEINENPVLITGDATTPFGTQTIRCIDIARYNGYWHFENEFDGIDVVAWMPLPEPYKGER